MQRQLSTPAMASRFPEEEEEDRDDDLEAKPEKKAPAVRSPATAGRYVHLVPLLTVLCFLILFLCSSKPSTSDMSGFGGKDGSRKPKLL